MTTREDRATQPMDHGRLRWATIRILARTPLTSVLFLLLLRFSLNKCHAMKSQFGVVINIVTVIGIFAVISLGSQSCRVGDQRLLWIGPQCCLSTEVDLELAARKLGHMLFYLSPKSGTQYKGSLVKYSTYWCTRFSVGMNWEWPPLRDSVFFEQLPRSYLADLGQFFLQEAAATYITKVEEKIGVQILF